MIHDDKHPATTHEDPARLLELRSKTADLLAGYAKETRPAQREGLASWFRLQRRLNAALDAGAAGASVSRRWTWRVRVASGVLTAALGVAVLANMVPSWRAGRGDVGRSSGSIGGVGAGGASGSVENGGPGVGGMEGAGGGEKSTGASGSDGTAAAGTPARWDLSGKGCPRPARVTCSSRMG